MVGGTQGGPGDTAVCGCTARPTGSSFTWTLPMVGQQLVLLNCLEAASKEVWRSPKERRTLGSMTFSLALQCDSLIYVQFAKWRARIATSAARILSSGLKWHTLCQNHCGGCSPGPPWGCFFLQNCPSAPTAAGTRPCGQRPPQGAPALGVDRMATGLEGQRCSGLHVSLPVSSHTEPVPVGLPRVTESYNPRMV